MDINIFGMTVATDGWKGDSTEDEHAVCLEFMPDGKLKRFKHFESGWFKKELNNQINDWADKEI